VLQVASLGSGSAGNALLVRSSTTLLLLDCGFTLKETTARMARLGLSPADIHGVLLSHEHGDHIRGVGPLSRKFAKPVWLTHGTYNALRDQRFSDINLIHAHDSFEIGDIHINPFRRDAVRFACVTDLGTCTPHVQQTLAGVHGLLVESNYDETMLTNGPYPLSLQARIRSDFGHLGNVQAGELVKKLDHAELQTILLGHLSEQNNTDDAASSTMASYLPAGDQRVTVLKQHSCSPWFDIVAPNEFQFKADSAASSQSVVTE
jgi:phosphoribosyl 1,2-cyclic phosphodiesterase